MPLSRQVTGILKRAALAILTIASITAAATSADARPKHRQHAQAQQQVIKCDMRGCSDSVTATQAERATRQGRRNAAATTAQTETAAPTRQSRRQARAQERAQIADANGNGTILGSRPSGCPHRFCGCEASLYVFGEIRKELNLAANWVRKFPRAQAAPGMVAARSGHVFVLISQVSGNEWMVHDGNSGGGKTRQHVRSISGYAIVNPHASRYAAN